MSFKVERELAIVTIEKSSAMIFPQLSILLFLLILLSHGGFVSVTTTTTHDAPVKCIGSIAECNADLEILMESEVTRRFLATKYISPGALKRDEPVCRGGASGEAYSKTGGCLPPQSNPYNRGCSKYYRCRSDA
ncbi:protein RALF-like 32 [Rhododendron vialii]|uniref:protein RALF-like 32 n=1 Tax=Rhododendron vialii TaxID=182163 RepID=UPI00265F1254|nr:protein RALF-like 32 [Rhododendron vialii]